MRISKYYSEGFIEQVSKILSNCLCNIASKVALEIVKENFSLSVVNKESSLRIFINHLLLPIFKIIFDSKQFYSDLLWLCNCPHFIKETFVEYKIGRIIKTFKNPEK